MDIGEKAKNGIEPGEKNEWSELEKLAQDKPTSVSADKVVRNETQEEKQEKISQAKAKVEESYRKSNIKESSSAETETVEDEPSSQEQLPSTAKRKLSKYDMAERSRIDRIKSNISFLNIHEYESMQIASRPSAFTKTIRLIADKLGIKTKRSEERRDGEAMYVALSEFREEEAARRKDAEETEKALALEMERRNAEYEAEKARRKKEATEEGIEEDLAMARRTFDERKHEGFKRQRIQEIVERDLNSRLLKVDDLEMEVISENPEIQKRTVSFEDTDIPVYDLKGLPFSLLSTTIDYRRGLNPGQIGTETFRRIMDDPSIWAERRDEAEKASGFGTRNANARGDTICTSYWNSERNIDSHMPGNLIYGFESVRADSIIKVDNGDGNTGNMAGKDETALSDPDAIKQLEGADGACVYNEVLLRRYTENGIPKKPDYIIVESGIISKESLRHAKYFGIPIINIERSIYTKKAEKRGEELLASISEDDTYKEMDKKIEELSSMSRYKKHIRTLEGIGRNYDMLLLDRRANAPLEQRCSEISQMEQLKRLDFIKSTLEEAIHNIESATEKGLPAEQNLPGFDYFDINIQDVQNRLKRTEDSDKSFFGKPGDCNSINIEFKLKGSSRNVRTSVYDGERIYEAEEALANGKRTKQDIENADSSFYNTLEPVVLRYFEAIRKNQRLAQ